MMEKDVDEETEVRSWRVRSETWRHLQLLQAGKSLRLCCLRGINESF